ncbi:MAG: hypothetical protein ABIV47_21035 [Roseiflexaceae bacterium]
MRRLALLIMLCTLAVAVSACEFSASTASITSAELAHGYVDGKATDTSTTFAPSDTPLHYVVTLGSAPDDTKVKAVWTIVDAGDGQFKDQKLDETELQSGSGVLNFTLAGKQEWPVGKYKVDLFLNDKLERSADFLVQ